MKLSNWDQAAEYVARLKLLQAALEAVKYNQLHCTVIDDHSLNAARYDIAKITSIVEMRSAITDVLRSHIVSAKAGLKTYGVDTDA